MLIVTDTGTLTANGTEQTIGSEKTDGKIYIAQIDLSNMAFGDYVEFRVKVKAISGGSAITMYKSVYSNAQPFPALQTPAIPAPYSVTFTLKQTLGSSYKQFPYSLVSL